ncbi:hypothetical protein HPP92_029108 [Vanilla planifolia]|uniref:Uncharacterized protein n=1 Tax=Vanilla planifolia TaxID=51239 RepID=A0A835P3L2_VANPL|nr:hypothetical protein HPP92_029108 [Vanilla planifolia]KAG0445904.1 hypothetical protein HPP92_029097 [Vanilla planifolia]
MVSPGLYIRVIVTVNSIKVQGGIVATQTWGRAKSMLLGAKMWRCDRGLYEEQNTYEIKRVALNQKMRRCKDMVAHVKKNNNGSNLFFLGHENTKA